MNEVLAAHYLWIKAAHVVSVIFWMAGMLYLPRLFVYHCAAIPGGELDETLKLQERRLLKGIVNPAMVATWTFAVLMLVANPGLLSTGWFHVKFALVFLLSGVHSYYAGAVKRFASGNNTRSHVFWRVLNEAPAVIAFIVVFLAILKPGG
jgi:putative membrane protein